MGSRALSLQDWRPDLAPLLEQEIEPRLRALQNSLPPDDNSHPILVVENGQELVGLAFVTFAGEAPCPFAVVEDLLVDASQRGSGLGKAILDWIMSEALAVHSVAVQRKASTTALTRSTWPQRIFVADMAAKDQASVRADRKFECPGNAFWETGACKSEGAKAGFRRQPGTRPRSRKSTVPPEKVVKTALNKRLQKDALFGLRRSVHEIGHCAQWFHYCSSACAGRRVIGGW
jgi:GNAT superfamily N-acetyltransferase